MAHPGMNGLDTPRTNLGDATYLSRQPDFDITQEPSFQSPTKDANVLQQMRNGGRPSLRTPRGSRAPFTDRKNLPAGIGGAEFTPLLKSATRNSARRHSGKENGAATPAFLGRIDEDMTPMPAGESSVYMGSRNTSSYMDNTPLPQADNSSAASTPLMLRSRDDAGRGPLQDGNQLSLREQENVIDRIEKENFGLKLKIHFLEEALRKAGPGLSEAALKENTELKVDQVTMQRELQRYKKHLTSAEKELESYRLTILEMQERAKRKQADGAQRAEMERLQQALEEKEAEIADMQRRVDEDQHDQDDVERLRDEVGDLEAEIRSKDVLIGEHEDQIDALQSKLDEAEDKMKDAQRHAIELEQKAQASDELDEAKDTIEDLEATVRRLEQQVDDMKEKLDDAVTEKDRAEGDLEELQEEMANKSVVTKGLSRQVEEKVVRLQGELDRAKQDLAVRESTAETSQKEVDELKQKMKDLRQERDSSERIRQALATKTEEMQAELHARNDEKALLQTRHDALTDESASLQREVAKLQRSVAQLEADLASERQHSLDIERDIRAQYKDDMERLNDDISDLQAEVREKDNLYDNDSEKWETARHQLESERDLAEEKAAGLQRTVDTLRAAEGGLSDKEAKLKEAIKSEADRHQSEEVVLKKQIDNLRQDLEARQAMLEDLRTEISTLQDALRQSQLDCQSQAEKLESLEDEVEVLQSTMDGESEKARRECELLRQQLASRDPATGSAAGSPKQSTEGHSRIGARLDDAVQNLVKVQKEKQALQDQLATVQLELHSLRTSLAETKAERDEMEGELRNLKQQGEDTFQLDQEHVNLRTAKMKLDSEVRRLKEENKHLAEQRQSVELALEDEIEKAAAEEERLNHEVLQLQAKVRQGGDSQELVAARRTIRELERKVEDCEGRLAISALVGTDQVREPEEGHSELSLMRRDLSAARQKEVELLQCEAAHRDTVKGLKRQIADLERKSHEAELARLMASPTPTEGGSSSAHRGEVAELRNQLSTAHQTVRELKKSLREAEGGVLSAAEAGEVQARLEELEEQKTALESALEEAQAVADEAVVTHERAMARYKAKMQQYREQRDELAVALRDEQERQHNNKDGDNTMDAAERRDLHAMLKQTQIEADALEHDVREQRGQLADMAAVEVRLRGKLERARSERAAFRAGAEKLSREVRRLTEEQKRRRQRHRPRDDEDDEEEDIDVLDGDDVAVRVEGDQVVRMSGSRVPASSRHRRRSALDKTSSGGSGADTDAIVRAAEAAEQRHVKELRGLTMQLDWLRAAWDREVQLRQDAAFAKRFLLLQLDVRDACNKVDLAILDDIHRHLQNGKTRPGNTAVSSTSRLRLLPAPSQDSKQQQQQQPHALVVSSSSSSAAAAVQPGPPRAAPRPKPPFSLRRLAIVVRFVVRAQIAARKWAAHEHVRRRFLEAVNEQRRRQREDAMAAQWRAGAALRRDGRALESR